MPPRLRLILPLAALALTGAGLGLWVFGGAPQPADEVLADAAAAGAMPDGPALNAAPPPAQVADGRIIVPSGQEITLQDVVLGAPGPDGLTARFRFLAPAIARNGGTVDFQAAARDMEALCTGYALPRVTEGGPLPAQIVISLSDIAVPFGEAAPEATQYFEAYTLRDNACIWEVY